MFDLDHAPFLSFAYRYRVVSGVLMSIKEESELDPFVDVYPNHVVAIVSFFPASYASVPLTAEAEPMFVLPALLWAVAVYLWVELL